jgi:menaquinone-specific isochorismate synthase
MVTEVLEYTAPLNLAMFPPFLNQRYEDRYSYGFEFEGEGLCGVTPELLFSVSDGRLKTMALAGTGPAGGPSLLQDPKERHEHQLVIEYLAEALKPWGEFTAGSTGEKTYGVLKHLRTPVEVKLNRVPDFMHLAARLHPTAALGGWPRQPAWHWLEAQSFHATRSRFGAPFGFVDGRGEKMLCVVAIRSVQWKDNCARISAGCGVVRESETLREWQELQLKLKSVHQLLGMEEA